MAIASAIVPTPQLAHAEPVVCVMISYSIDGSPTDYIIDECYMPTSWDRDAGSGPDCKGFDDTEACYFIGVSTPA